MTNHPPTSQPPIQTYQREAFNLELVEGNDKPPSNLQPPIQTTRREALFWRPKAAEASERGCSIAARGLSMRFGQIVASVLAPLICSQAIRQPPGSGRLHSFPGTPEWPMSVNKEDPKDKHVAVGQNQWYNFGAGALPILVYFGGDWGCPLEVRDFDPWPCRMLHGYSVSCARLAGERVLQFLGP